MRGVSGGAWPGRFRPDDPLADGVEGAVGLTITVLLHRQYVLSYKDRSAGKKDVNSGSDGVDPTL